jgi:hypothetical protein
MMETIPLFAEPPRVALKPSKTLVPSGPRPVWSSHKGRRVACDECVIYLHENRGNGPLPRSARRVRTVRAFGEKLWLCHEHALPREEADRKAAEKEKTRVASRTRRGPAQPAQALAPPTHCIH